MVQDIHLGYLALHYHALFKLLFVNICFRSAVNDANIHFCLRLQVSVAHFEIVMDDYLYTIHDKNIENTADNIKAQALSSLESGKLIYLPDYSFKLLAEEQILLSESILDPKHKNISYDALRQRLAGLVIKNIHPTLPALAQTFMHRFAIHAKTLIDTLLPQYTHDIRWGRTSYRPAEIKGRSTSKRKDDTRIHVDAFAATPVNGLRILRVFCNVNPYGEPRVWQVGEPFAQVLNRFSQQIPPFNAIGAKLLNLIHATKTLRSPYDHNMLHLHDKMKLDDDYQQTLIKQRIEFPTQSTWLVFTDNVSHAVLSGQFLLEQTFYLPVNAMLNPELSPLQQWEKKAEA